MLSRRPIRSFLPSGVYFASRISSPVVQPLRPRFERIRIEENDLVREADHHFPAVGADRERLHFDPGRKVVYYPRRRRAAAGRSRSIA